MKKFTLIALLSLSFFQLLAQAPSISRFTPTAANRGMTVNIFGVRFTGATAVRFGGTQAASFTVLTDTSIRAVVAGGASGQVQVTTASGTGSRVGFNFVLTAGVITDFGGFWNASGVIPNETLVDSSHNLLAFTYNDVVYSTGVNNGILNSHSITYVEGSWRALPVAGVSGNNDSTRSTYIALASKVDGSASVAIPANVRDKTIKSVLVDGSNGLDLGTGVTNLPGTAQFQFPIDNFNADKITDAEPDILLTQIASPSAGNDVFSFVNASGTVVGNTVTQDMTQLPRLGSYMLDLFRLPHNAPYNSATVYNTAMANVTRDIRIVAFRLSDFGITPGNISQVRSMRVSPSGNSDYAFIAYNASTLNIPPTIAQDSSRSHTRICAGATADMTVIATAASGGALAYSWEQSTNNGSTWTAVTDGGAYSGSTTSTLAVVGPANNTQFRATVIESGNGTPVTSNAFSITVTSSTPPATVSVAGGGAACLNVPVQLTPTVSGSGPYFYQWQGNATGSFQDIPDANLETYTPPVNQTGSTAYRLLVSGAKGCPATTSGNNATVTITGISSTTGAERCGPGSVTLSATATSGTINWFAAEAGGSSLQTGASYPTSSISNTQTYYVASSGCASALRVPVTATIHPPSAGGALSGDTSVVTGTNTATLSLADYTGSILNWQSSTDNFSSLINDVPETGPQLTVSDLTSTTQYRALVQSGNCAGAFSTLATVTVVPGSLPIDNTSLRASRQSGGVLIEWTAYDQQNTRQFEIERSTDGWNFTGIGQLPQTGSTTARVEYRWLDTDPQPGVEYYRVREWLLSGASAVSSIVKVDIPATGSAIRLYPNPVTNGTAVLHFQQMEAGNYRVQVYNSVGQQLTSQTLRHGGGSLTHQLPLDNRFQGGLYKVAIISPSGKTTGFNLLVIKK
ncbi:MAG: T9SS type A sorting domain-containing protein [Candidatus Pseudobacter hemicellulosilyticus]|uniref:T9SS type A sorting domain-containing protein n=1 Tax=Candidatus Pseudobacter hemicellulosilyticus TaxID=3121375 RepID=A0AAJ5WNM5_9BACT|nr:MAG: T9SS type A sorting domain-containing protein [Pseudobacter sp.]